MDKIDDNKYILKFWATKYITEPDKDGYIFKFFKNISEHKPYSFEEQNNLLRRKKEYIWRFIPETELIRNDDGSYYIKQKYIEWKLLKYINVDQLDEKLLSDLLELFNWYIEFCKNEWIEIDIFGYQEDINNIENIRKRRFLFYTRMLNSFLSSTNIMISNDNKVYMIDVCDTIPIPKGSQKFYKLKRTIKQSVKQAITELWIKKTRFRIHRLIDEKRKNLYNVLS
jgi:hypothetical protein